MRLHVLESGEGPPVALLHGLFGRAQNLGAVARALSARHRVLSIDLRNHGASPHAPGMAYADLAADVRETLAAAGALPARVLGHSMGGKVAMVLALTDPAAVSRLLVADIAPVVYTHRNRAIADALQALSLPAVTSRAAADAALAARIPDAALRAFLLQNFAPSPVPHWRIGLDQIAASLPAIEGWPAALAGRRYDGPTLFVAGGASDFIVPAYHAAILALFPASSIVTLPGAGHWLHADQPEAFAGAVAAFVDADGI